MENRHWCLFFLEEANRGRLEYILKKQKNFCKIACTFKYCPFSHFFPFNTFLFTYVLIVLDRAYIHFAKFISNHFRDQHEHQLSLYCIR